MNPPRLFPHLLKAPKYRALLDGDVLLECLYNRNAFIKDVLHLLIEIKELSYVDLYVTEHALNRVTNEHSDTELASRTAEFFRSGFGTENIVPVTRSTINKARQLNFSDFDSAVENVCAIEYEFDAIITLNPSNFTEASVLIWEVSKLKARVTLESYFADARARAATNVYQQKTYSLDETTKVAETHLIDAPLMDTHSSEVTDVAASYPTSVTSEEHNEVLRLSIAEELGIETSETVEDQVLEERLVQQEMIVGEPVVCVVVSPEVLPATEESKQISNARDAFANISSQMIIAAGIVSGVAGVAGVTGVALAATTAGTALRAETVASAAVALAASRVVPTKIPSRAASTVITLTASVAINPVVAIALGTGVALALSQRPEAVSGLRRFTNRLRFSS